MATAGGKLTAVAIKAASVGKQSDGGGLYLDVRANGSRYWRMKYRHAGKERLLSFGVYPDVTLAEARRRRDAAREAIRDGRDPMADRKADKARAKLSSANTFQVIAEEWLDKQRAKLAAVSPGHRLHFLLNGGVDGIDIEQEVFTLLADPALDVHGGAADHDLYQAYERYPSVVASALVRRIKQGLEIPFRAHLLVQEQHIVTDEDPIRSMVNNAALDEKVRTNAASIAGPVSIGQLIDAQLELDHQATEDRSARRDFAGQRRVLAGLVLTSPYSSLVAAVLARADTAEPRRIALLADLLASDRDQHRSTRPPVIIADAQKGQLVSALVRWVAVMVDAPGSSRAELAEVARAIGSVGDSELVGALDRLLSEELRRWEISRAAFAASGYRDQTSDARNSWSNWYQRAFIAIGTEQAENLLTQRLAHPEFGAEAASALMQLWEQRHPVTAPSTFSRTFLREMAVRRGRRLREHPPAPAALAILDTVRSLLEGGNEHEQLHAIRLAVAAFRMPCGDISNLARRLIELPVPLRLQQDLYIALALSGERLPADAIQSCIRALLAEAVAKPWVLGDNGNGFFRWVELLAFSERPAAMLDEVAALEQPNLKRPYQLRGLLAALGASTESEVENVLLQFAALIPGLPQQHEWLAALRTRGTESSGRALLQLLRDGAFDDPGHGDIEALGAYLAQLAKSHPDFRVEMLGLLDHLDEGILASAIERALLMLSDTESILSLVHYYARTGQSGDGLYMSIKAVAVDERPSAQFSGALVLFPVPADDLRRRLFAIALTRTGEADVATECLALIDGIRDDYGYPEPEARHPHIRSGHPWPMLT